MLTYQGRLPGVACTTTLPTEPQPIRLDVPAFVGLAERGPLNQPTPVEDINQYQAVFGGDLVLAQSAGVPVYASLPTTVKSFFDNGGLRCYVVRVAGPNAVAARWLVPGLRRWWPDGTSGRCSWTRRGRARGQRASRWAPSCSVSRWPSSATATTCRPARTAQGC